MMMHDWINELDKFTEMYGKGVLQGKGSISRPQADKKAEKEFRTYEARTLSPVEQAYLDNIKQLEKTAVKQLKKQAARGKK